MSTQLSVINAPYFHRKHYRRVYATRLSNDVSATRPYKIGASGNVIIGSNGTELPEDPRKLVYKVNIDNELATVTNVRYQPVHDTILCICDQNRDHTDNLWTFDESLPEQFLRISKYALLGAGIGYIILKIQEKIN
jgi:hypothetical protein